MNNPHSAQHALAGARPSRSARADWLIPAGLVALSIVPAIGGTSRMMQLFGGAAVTPENARFFASSVPVTLHIVSVVIYSILGAFQFAPGFRRRKPNWHRVAGRILVPCGLIAAVSGLWMTQFYPSVDFDGPTVYFIRLVVGTAMAVALVLGTTAIMRRDIKHHRAWMMRAYALGLGAGTQVLTHIPWFVFPSIRGELARTIFMAAGWAINLAVAEWFIARGRRRRVA
jgi:uncharacterized membrane protein